MGCGKIGAMNTLQPVQQKNEIPIISGFSLLVALATSGGQALKAALADPVESLRCK
ncbi:MAG TPA: hypothetical protein VMW42_03855 [Desulfatiglandales bacterium]|nr:hypothetical protein [Desulfatiglandales bacterium]